MPRSGAGRPIEPAQPRFRREQLKIQPAPAFASQVSQFTLPRGAPNLSSASFLRRGLNFTSASLSHHGSSNSSAAPANGNLNTWRFF